MAQHLSPPTAYIVWLLAADRTRQQAGEEARRLGVPRDVARFYFENVRKR